MQFTFDGIFEEILDQLGQMPLPPYITHQLEDKDRYNTVYAAHSGSAAGSYGGTAFYTGTSGGNPEKRRRHRQSNASCRTWDIPARKSG